MFLNVGSVTELITVFAIIAAAYVIMRGGGATALTTLSEANRVLENRVHELEMQVKHDQGIIAELRARTDITLAIKPLIDAVINHENQAQDRFEKTTAILDTIAERLTT